MIGVSSMSCWAAKAYARKNDYDLVESKDGSYKAKKRKKGEPHGRY